MAVNMIKNPTTIEEWNTRNYRERMVPRVELNFAGSPEDAECEGHESLAGAHMGESVFCDGSCNPYRALIRA